MHGFWSVGHCIDPGKSFSCSVNNGDDAYVVICIQKRGRIACSCHKDHRLSCFASGDSSFLILEVLLRVAGILGHPTILSEIHQQSK
jgi:uncharacterized phosphosugar-binding protein